MRDDVRYALAIGPSSKVEDRTIDITTTGRSSGSPLRIEIVFYRIEVSIHLSGVPAPRPGSAHRMISKPPSIVRTCR
jgi:hypothetical protein